MTNLPRRSSALEENSRKRGRKPSKESVYIININIRTPSSAGPLHVLLPVSLSVWHLLLETSAIQRKESNRRMENFPGGFPEMYPQSSGHQGPHSDLDVDISTQISSTEEALLVAHTRTSLNSRRRSFRKDIVFKLDCLTYVYIFIVYLYDCSLLLLLLRVSVQMATLIMQYSSMIRQLIPKSRSKRSAFQFIVIVNAVSALTHHFRTLPIPNSDGYIFGHHTLQTIGQRQLSDKRWLLAFDAVLFYLQLLVFTSQYSLKKDEKLSRAATMEEEFDGAQGHTVAMKLPLLSVLKVPYVDVDTLKAEDELEAEQYRRVESQLDSLLGDERQQYGSVPNELF